MVVIVYDNTTYSLSKLDGMRLKIHMAKKKVKAFKKRDNRFNSNNLTNFKNLNLSQEKDVKSSEKDE